MAALRWTWLGTLPYADAWSLQRRCAEMRRDGTLEHDLVLMLEHPPVFTMGRQGDVAHLGGGADALRAAGAEYIEVDRGGSVTFHGPGQLVAYPIVDLASMFPIPGHPRMGDVLRYVRALEQAVIDTAQQFGVTTERRPPFTGVWRGNDKLAAIGVKLARGVTTHGIGFNVNTDLAWFSLITPCGIDGAGVCSLQTLGVRDVTPQRIAPHVAAALGDAFHAEFVADPFSLGPIAEPVAA
ncbi:MAG: lipoyl(octanoyl) transferase LipB [Candidatus Dormibacteraeota bacterium]|nr:lipoyl(octanoyl) transferase LipB [Candidatus Dormibacteraeota bacterium]